MSSDEQYAETMGKRMTEFPIERRNLLQATGAGLLGTAGVGAAQTTGTQETSGGDLIWEFTQPSGSVRSSPTVADGTVYVGSYDDTLYAVDAATGTQEWAFDTSGSVRSSPTVVDGTVYFGIIKYQGGTLYAVDAATGSEEWTFTQPSRGLSSSPTVLNGTVYIGSNDNTLYAVDADSGDREWAFDTSGRVFSSPTVADGTVYVGSDGTFDSDYEDSALYAVDAATGDQEWAFTQPSGRVFSSPTVADGTVYVGSNGTENNNNYDDAALYAVDAGVEGSSEDSRVLLRTLGHHDGKSEQLPALNLKASTALPQGVVPGGVEKISLSVTNTTSNSLNDIAFGLDPESLPDGWGVDDHIEGAGDSPNYKKILNSWDDSTTKWTIDELGSGETLSAAVTVKTTDSAPAGTQQSITARTGVDSPDDITTDVTVSLVTRFDPSVHGFGFANWASGDNTYPAHDHSSIALDEFSQLITESFIPDLQDGDVQIPGYAAPLLVSLLYPVINSGAATNGHCYGMVYASQEYYKSGVPVTGVSTANEILTPGVEDDAVGDDIDFYQNTQYLDTDVLTPMLLLCVFDKSPDHYGAVLDDIQNTIEDQGTAPLALSTSGEGGGHSVLAYDVTDSAAGQSKVHVYDPSSPFDLDKASSVPQEYDLWAKRISVNNPSGILDFGYTTSITFDTTGADTTIESSYRGYDQILPLKDGGDVDNPIQTFGKYVTGSLFALIADFLAGLITFEITLSSPDGEATTGSTQETSPSAEVTVTDPSGESLFALEAESGVDRSDLEFDAFRYQTAADPGQYGVTIDAEDSVEYTIQAKGEIEDAGSIEATESGTVAPEEGQALLKATVPEDPEESGRITPGVPSLPGYENSPQDLDGDGLFEDVNGDGEFTIFDVQAFFTNFQSEIVQSNPAAFNFTEEEDPEEVTIFDVQALFQKLS